MTIRNVIAAMNPNTEARPLLDAALQVAQRFNGNVEALYVTSNPASELMLAPESLISVDINHAQLEKIAFERAALARSRFTAWRAGKPAGEQNAAWSEHEGLLEAVLERRGRLADLLVLHHPVAGAPDSERAFDAGVFGTGRPCLLVRDTPVPMLFEHVAIAWNGSLEGARAVGGAMPILEAARQVSIFNVPQLYDDTKFGHELARALAGHGIEARILPNSEALATVGGRLLTCAEAEGVTLLVMGAYTHSRMRQRLLGGVTRHVLAHAAVPILMAH